MTNSETCGDGPDNADVASSPLGEPLGDELAILRTVVEALGEVIIITDADLGPSGPRIQYVNPAFTRLTGYAADEILGQTPRFLQGPSTDRAMLDDLRMALAAGRSFRGEAINYRKDGSEYIVEWMITPVRQEERVMHWAAVQRDVTEIRRSQKQRRELAAEVNHRVNNTLAAMQSVASQTARKAQTVPEFKLAFEKRLRALAGVHRLLAQHQWVSVPLETLVTTQIMPYVGGDMGRLVTAGPKVALRPGAAVALGMALSELAANAADHGALSIATGTIRLDWHMQPARNGDRLSLRWAETGGPPVQLPASRGFGSRMVEHALSQELKAEARLLFEPCGLRCEIDIPLQAAAAEVF